MRNDLDKIIKIFESKIPRKIVAIYDGGNKYLLATSSKTNDKFANLDPYYTISKNATNISGFNPMSDIKWYNETINKLIYGEDEDQEDPLEIMEEILSQLE